MPKYFAAALTALFLLNGCMEHGSDEYIGRWVNVKTEKRIMDIVKNGEGYIVRNTEPGMTSGKSDTTNIPATLKDGGLQINNGFGTIVLVVDRSTGHLTSAIGEFRKVN